MANSSSAQGTSGGLSTRRFFGNTQASPAASTLGTPASHNSISSSFVSFNQKLDMILNISMEHATAIEELKKESATIKEQISVFNLQETQQRKQVGLQSSNKLPPDVSVSISYIA